VNNNSSNKEPSSKEVLTNKLAALSPAKRALLEQRLLQKGKQETAKKSIVSSRANHDSIPLSFAQQRLWFLDQLIPNTSLYNIPKALRIRGSLNVRALKKSIDTVVNRHEVLRTTIKTVDGNPMQFIAELGSVGVNVIQVSINDQDTIQSLISTETQRPFNLASDLMLRATLLEIEPTEHIFILVMHHIASDGWSMEKLFQELIALYNAFSTDSSNPLAELPIQYADFACWQRQWFTEERLQVQLEYWQKKLSGMPALIELPTDHSRPLVQTFKGDQQKFYINKQLTSKLQQLSQQNKGTLFMTLFTAFIALLARYTNSDDIVVGSPIANRNHREIEPLIGFFVNTLVLRTDLSGNPTFQDLLIQVRQVALEAYDHQDVPFEQLVEHLHPERNLAYHPLFQIMFVLQNATKSELNLSGVEVSNFEISDITAKFDITMIINETEQGLTGHLEYNSDLFEGSTITRIIGHFQVLLEGIVNQPETSISELPLITKAEQQQLLVEWNQTQTEYPKHQCIHQCFEEQVTRTPNAVALIFEGQKLSYIELNQKANQLAHYLQSLSVKPETIVGICIERSCEMIIGLLGILKAGAAYLPLDISYPTARLSLMLGDAHPPVILTSKKSLESLPENQAQTVCLDTWDDAGLSHFSSDNPITEVKSTNLAYTMYTSGSTGVPKGTNVIHRGVVRLVKETNYINLSDNDVFLQLASISFDASTFEIWGALLNGAKLIVMPPLTPSLKDLGQAIKQHQATILWLTAGLFRLMVDERVQDLRSIRQLLAGGEVLPIPQVHKVLEELPDCQLINGYGPTENTTFTCCYPITKSQIDISVPIGRPIANTLVYILDTQLQPVPIGIPGELHIGGDGLARGYLNRPELTAEKFISNPFSTDPHARLYKTGDLASYLPDGNIQFHGRIDNQVKLRGFRIELGEIETALLQHPEIREAVVIDREDHPSDKRLVAYIVPKEQKVMAGIVRQFLVEELPEYMLPSAFVYLDSIPLTSNGKIDRRALPLPDMLESIESDFISARTPTEELLTTIWADTLNINQIGVHDNFFELGGHSLLATQVISRLRDVFSVELPLQDLFKSPSIAGLSELIDAVRNDQQVMLPSIQKNNQKGDIPLSFAQQRLWFLNQLEPNTSLYNISTAIKVTGMLNVEVLNQSLNAIVDRHEILRTTLKTVDENPMQIISDSHPEQLKVKVISSGTNQPTDIQYLLNEEAHLPFDLSSDLMIRATLLQQPTEHILILVIHHIACDGWSMGVLFRELTALYHAFSTNSPTHLAELPIQYADFSCWQRQYLTKTKLQKQLIYWQEKLTDVPVLFDFPTDHPRPLIQTYRGTSQNFKISKDQTNQLQRLSQQSGATLFMTLLTAFVSLLGRYSNSDDVVVGSPIANRTNREIEPLIGCFINTLVLRSDISGNPSFQGLLTRVKQVALEAYDHQDIPFEQLVDALQPERNLSNNPLFQIMFILQNTPKIDFELPGLNISPFEIKNDTAKFDLTLSVTETVQGLDGRLEYNTDIFEAATISRMIGHFQVLLDAIIAQPNLPISSLPLLTEQERQQLLVEWNPTQAEPPTKQTFLDLFQSQAEKSPHHTAFVFNQQSLSYQQLNIQSNQLAHYLMSLGVSTETLVGISIERSLDMVIGLLGILKAGGAYVPIDPAYPNERIAFMLADAQVSIFLTQSDLVSNLPNTSAQVVCLDNDWPIISQQRKSNPTHNIGPDNLAYVIYTSGSTGTPKGVQVQHGSLHNFLISLSQRPGLSHHDTLLAVTTISFDIAALELYLPLIVGAKCVLLSRDVASDGLQLLETLQQTEITVMQATPATWLLLLAAGWKGSPQLKVFVGGEALPQNLASQLLDKNQAVWNLYGPTEATVWCCIFQIGAKNTSQTKDNKVSIGRPINNTQIYILDRNIQPVPIGIPGELHIGGDALARGYLNRPELTAEKFIPNPFCNDPHSRLYKTGDLASYLPDGNIQFHGRIDNQIKLRGFRIELGEIETALLQHPEVRDAVVVDREDESGDKRLVAYLLAHSEEVMPLILRQFLLEKLPAYMLPSAFVYLDSIPLTPNGKVDRRALPKPGYTYQDTFIAPADKLEQQLATIWERVLNIHSIGRHDNFFELGGNSLLAVTLLMQLENTFGKGLTVITIFQAPTIEQFAKILRDKGYITTWRALLAIQTQGTRPPLFIIGTTNNGHALAPSLGNQQPIYGLNMFGLQAVDGATTALTVESMAKQYIQEIQSIQAEGPYYLCAYCGDAKVAYEMAQQLQKQNQLIGLLAFIDVVWHTDPVKLNKKFIHFLDNLTELKPNYLLLKIRGKAKYYWKQILLKRDQKRAHHLQKTGSALLTLELQHKLLIKAFENALKQYQPQPYSEDITLFLSDELHSKQTSVLEELATKGLEIYKIPGFHDTIFEPSNVGDLGKLLKKCIERNL